MSSVPLVHLRTSFGLDVEEKKLGSGKMTLANLSTIKRLYTEIITDEDVFFFNFSSKTDFFFVSHEVFHKVQKNTTTVPSTRVIHHANH